MREFLKIALNLTVISLLAAGVLGLVFMQTEKARKANEAQYLEESMLRYVDGPAEDLRFEPVLRFLVQEGDETSIGYALFAQHGPMLLLVNAHGDLLEKHDLPLTEHLSDEEHLLGLLAKTLPGKKFRLTDSYFLAFRKDTRVAAFIQGRTGGFKTWVHMLVALDQDNTIKGLEILEHEEDPGLGGEIETEYFRNQFAGRTLEALNHLKVIKMPLPGEYRRCLEASKWASRGLSEEDAAALCDEFADDDIYAITGATISSTRVTNGLKKLVRAFVKRMEILEKAAQDNDLDLRL